MGKADVLINFETDLTNPASQKSGEQLRAYILRSAKAAVAAGDREGLIEALREWLADYTEPRTMLAVYTAGKLKLVELRSELEALETAVSNGKAFHPFYHDWIKEALEALS